MFKSSRDQPDLHLHTHPKMVSYLLNNTTWVPVLRVRPNRLPDGPVKIGGVD